MKSEPSYAIWRARECLALAESTRACGALGRRASDFGLFGYLERVVNLDAEVPHGALELRMAEQKLHRSQVSSSPVNQGWLGTPDRVRSVSGRIKADLLHLGVHDTSVLACAQVRRRMQSAWKQVVVWAQCRRLDPGRDRLSR